MSFSICSDRICTVLDVCRRLYLDSLAFALTNTIQEFASIHKASFYSWLIISDDFRGFAANFKFLYSQGYSAWCESSISMIRHYERNMYSNEAIFCILPKKKDWIFNFWFLNYSSFTLWTIKIYKMTKCCLMF